MQSNSVGMDTSIRELKKIFNAFNHMVFDSALEEPIIVVGRSKKKGLMGYCTTKKVWEDTNTKDEKYEINISGSALKIGLRQIATTMLHEMVHLHCATNGIKDTSNNYVYHNKKFKEQAELHGLIVTEEKTIGWSNSVLRDDIWDALDQYDIDEESFPYVPIDLDEEEKKKPTSVKLQCPKCGNKFTVSKYINVICGDCDQKFLTQEEINEGNEQEEI